MRSGRGTERPGGGWGTCQAKHAETQVRLTLSLGLPQVAGATEEMTVSAPDASAQPGYLGPNGCVSPLAGPGHQASFWPRLCPLPTPVLEAAGDCPQLKLPGRVAVPAAR